MALIWTAIVKHVELGVRSSPSPAGSYFHICPNQCRDQKQGRKAPLGGWKGSTVLVLVTLH